MAISKMLLSSPQSHSPFQELAKEPKLEFTIGLNHFCRLRFKLNLAWPVFIKNFVLTLL